MTTRLLLTTNTCGAELQIGDFFRGWHFYICNVWGACQTLQKTYKTRPWLSRWQRLVTAPRERLILRCLEGETSNRYSVSLLIKRWRLRLSPCRPHGRLFGGKHRPVPFSIPNQLQRDWRCCVSAQLGSYYSCFAEVSLSERISNRCMLDLSLSMLNSYVYDNKCTSAVLNHIVVITVLLHGV